MLDALIGREIWDLSVHIVVASFPIMAAATYNAFISSCVCDWDASAGVSAAIFQFFVGFNF
ncbi:hypothetical protein [Flavobacterium sp.]|uniref:hypothetical protein n=1 Tax=Flavobacterium sp. TaxID=239 RepID=UPI002F410739